MPFFLNLLNPMKSTLKKRAAIFLVILPMFFGSCAQPLLPPEPIQTTIQSAGDALFLGENFTNALLQYQHDYETALTPEDRSQALYGIGCSQLILAQSDNQLAEAIGTLEKWDTEKGDTQRLEDHHLFVVAMKVQSARIQKKNQDQAQLAKQKNTVIANQRKKITQLGGTVDNIQKQLQELEAIDETLQEKKRPL